MLVLNLIIATLYYFYFSSREAGMGRVKIPLCPPLGKSKSKIKIKIKIKTLGMQVCYYAGWAEIRHTKGE